MTKVEIIDNTEYCKKHNLIHAKKQNCPHCFKEGKAKEEKKKKSRGKKK